MTDSTPVEKVQKWLAAIGEKYDAELREELLREEFRELVAAMDDYHRAVFTLHADPTRLTSHCDLKDCLIAIARELIDVAIVALGNASLRGEDLGAYNLRPTESIAETRATIEQGLYDLFRDDQGSDSCYPIREVAAFYGFGDKLEACFAEVHRANMAKLECADCQGYGAQPKVANYRPSACFSCKGTGRRVNRTPDGKIVKPPGWEEPKLGPILFGGEK